MPRKKSFIEIENARIKKLYGPNAIILRHEGKYVAALIMATGHTPTDAFLAADCSPASSGFHVATDVITLRCPKGESLRPRKLKSYRVPRVPR